MQIPLQEWQVRQDQVRGLLWFLAMYRQFKGVYFN